MTHPFVPSYCHCPSKVDRPLAGANELTPLLTVPLKTEARIKDLIEAEFHQVGRDKLNTQYSAAF